ncbi:DUF2207 domain-containing protein [Chryseobacterium sp. MP_3.2]|uniref:DUF2207 domain-containing protein n=1 Tax=Chryseobacterium sp. MP_3.2 TaxID=3071712 RepID=UPI002DF9683A|nr:putative membrane protein YgcG [Chryseobacterium sp. MP_3.2]
MKRFIFLFFLLIFGLGNAQDVGNDTAAVSDYEHILSFHSDIEISKEAEVTVTEKIKVYASGEIIKRGIFRSLPLSRNINDKKVRIKYDIVSAMKNGEKENYHTKNTSSDLGIYFGNKNIILSPGIYEYELKYKTKDQIGFFTDYDEFYWNVNGNLWDLSVDQISATVTLPEVAEIKQTYCYTGAYGTSNPNCKENKISSNKVEWSAEKLQENEGLTIALGFAKGIFTPPPPPGFLEKYGIAILLILATIFLGFYYFSTWQKYGIDPQKPIVYPQFNAPQNLSPASIGYLEKGYYSGTMITSAIVNLAVKGFLKIIENDKRILGIFGGKEYQLEKIKEPDQTLAKEEINLMNQFFPGETKTVDFDGQYNSRIAAAVTDFTASLQYQHDTFLKKGNNGKMLIAPVLIVFALYAGALFLSHHLNFNGDYLGIGIVLFVVILVISIVFSLAFSKYPWIRYVYGLFAIGMIVAFFAAFTFDKQRGENINFYASYGFLILGSIGIVFYQFLIEQPTPEKLETLSLIDGFKMYLGTAEEKTLQFHNPPAMTPDVFEKMLPFAMVLGVDKIWGEKFQNMIKNSSMGGNQSYQSNWFVGASLMHMNFANSLNSSLSQSIASSATQPSSSGSGSGGGGFSGGGGGGGGGGGW